MKENNKSKDIKTTATLSEDISQNLLMIEQILSKYNDSDASARRLLLTTAIKVFFKTLSRLEENYENVYGTIEHVNNSTRMDIMEAKIRKKNDF